MYITAFLWPGPWNMFMIDGVVPVLLVFWSFFEGGREFQGLLGLYMSIWWNIEIDIHYGQLWGYDGAQCFSKNVKLGTVTAIAKFIKFYFCLPTPFVSCHVKCFCGHWIISKQAIPPTWSDVSVPWSRGKQKNPQSIVRRIMCGIKYHAIGRTLVAVMVMDVRFFREDNTLRVTGLTRYSITRLVSSSGLEIDAFLCFFAAERVWESF